MREYKQVHPVDKHSAEQAFASSDVEKICDAMVAVAFYEQDWKWAQDECLGFFKNENSDISGLAATCLGHIARVHRKLEKEKVIAVLRSRLEDAEIAGRIEDALDDIEQFV
ncbi:MAG TPA: hypothetical protein VGS79_22670 [Puia sp.]|nr:hypothetical protein [Puia sp.]